MFSHLYSDICLLLMGLWNSDMTMGIGSEPVMIRSDIQLQLDEWHYIEARKYGQMVGLCLLCFGAMLQNSTHYAPIMLHKSTLCSMNSTYLILITCLLTSSILSFLVHPKCNIFSTKELVHNNFNYF